MVVVLPDPFGPRNPNTLPVGTARSMPSTAFRDPNRFVEAVRQDGVRGLSTGGSALRGEACSAAERHRAGEHPAVGREQHVHERGVQRTAAVADVRREARKVALPASEAGTSAAGTVTTASQPEPVTVGFARRLGAGRRALRAGRHRVLLDLRAGRRR